MNTGEGRREALASTSRRSSALLMVVVVMVLLQLQVGVTAQPPGPSSSRVLVMQERGQPSAKTYARLLTPFPTVASPFTVCYRIQMYRFREESTLISYALDNTRDNELRMDHRVTGYKVALHSQWAESQLVTPIRYWTHFCLTVDLASGNWSVFLNGKKHDSGSFPPDLEPLDGGGVLVVGQEQDTLGGSFHQEQSFSGEFTELNIWRTVLDDDTIKQVALCEVYTEGDALSWSRQSWQTLGGVSWVSRSRDIVCDASTRRITFFPDRYTLTQAIHLCQVVGGQVGVPTTTQENTWLYQTSVGRAFYCSGGHGSSYMWLGAHDSQQERQWVYFSGEPIRWEGPWRGAGPNGGTVENCLVMLYDDFPGRWSDIACLDSHSFCTPCEFSERSTMYLRGRGVCDSSPFNRQYVLDGQSGGRPALSGFFHSDITWDAKAEAWVIASLKVSGAVARWMPITTDEYPFGTKPWTLGYDVCGLRNGEIVNMTLSVCNQKQFTCADGTCIDLQRRCDMREDCPDQSDEAQCKLVVIPPGYRPTLPPPSPTYTQPLPIRFSVNLVAFPSILTNDLTFVTRLQLLLAWKDSRLRYLNLKKDSSLNLLSPNTVLSIWTPRVFFKNAHGNVFTNTGEGSRVVCVREGAPQSGATDLTEETSIFTGSENTLQMSQVYSIMYNCDFHLGMFPFDVQVCMLNFTLVSASARYIKLQPGRAVYSGSHLIEYTVDGVSLKTGQEDQLSTMTVQTSSGLPKTSYFKMLDVWLFFSIVLIFAIVILHAMIEHTSSDTPLYASKSSTSNGVANGVANGGLTRVQTTSRPVSHKHGLVGPDPQTLDDYPRVRQHDYPGIRRPAYWPTHLLLLMAGRISVPLTFAIFNLVYWGSAMGETEDNPT
ncbi:uncharacterized protein [Panulirus ornatus]|uniref:uncharacterized protein isoform X2 n=1 Tax=Panulirus ornatus TaxID=150431 RepID=UPI003A87CEB1